MPLCRHCDDHAGRRWVPGEQTHRWTFLSTMAGGLAAWSWAVLSALDQNRSKSGFCLGIPSDIAAERGHCGRNRHTKEHSFRKCPEKRRLIQNVSLENSRCSRNGARIDAGFQIVSFRLGIAPDRVRPNDPRHPLPAGDVFRLFLHSSSCSVSRSGWPQKSWVAAEGRREQSRGGQKPPPDEKKGNPGDRLRGNLNHSGPRAPRASPTDISGGRFAE